MHLGIQKMENKHNLWAKRSEYELEDQNIKQIYELKLLAAEV